MPAITLAEQMLRTVSTCRAAQLAVFPNNQRHPLPMPQLIQQATSDRLSLAGTHLATADGLLLAMQFRSAISRHYYAMYHAARAITFAVNQGDDHEQHRVLPSQLPARLPNQGVRSTELTDARLLRNEADYDIYPMSESDWELDARALAPIAANFVQECEAFALNGYV